MNLAQLVGDWPATKFTFSELIDSDEARLRGIDNTPPAELLPNGLWLAANLQIVRVFLGVAMRINSGYRCKALNAAVGGSQNSDHMKFLAADFVAPKFGTPRDICRAIAGTNIPFQQLIYEYRWVHISFARPNETPKREVLTLLKSGGYAQGIK